VTVEQKVEEIMSLAKLANSPDPYVHLVWLIQGLDHWHTTGGKVGWTLDQVQRGVIASILNAGGLVSEPHNVPPTLDGVHTPR
jgi:hypothetical protein